MYCAVYGGTMNTAPQYSIRYTTSKNGTRTAYRTHPMSHRWFRMPLIEADLAIATDTASDETTEYNAMFRR